MSENLSELSELISANQIIISTNQITLIAITNLIAGLFQGLAFAFAMVYIARKFVPGWIHQLRMESLERNAIDKAMEGRVKYGV